MRHPPKTKGTAKRFATYQSQLKKCGFRSWKAANDRRAELIKKKNSVWPESGLNADETVEFENLQTLASVYWRWKSNDVDGRRNRWFSRKLGKLKALLSVEQTSATL